MRQAVDARPVLPVGAVVDDVLADLQSKISAPPPVSDSSPASISSSRISEAESPEIVSKWWISVAVNALSATSGRASLRALSERG